MGAWGYKPWENDTALDFCSKNTNDLFDVIDKASRNNIKYPSEVLVAGEILYRACLPPAKRWYLEDYSNHKCPTNPAQEHIDNLPGGYERNILEFMFRNSGTLFNVVFVKKCLKRIIKALENSHKVEDGWDCPEAINEVYNNLIEKLNKEIDIWLER